MKSKTINAKLFAALLLTSTAIGIALFPFWQQARAVNITNIQPMPEQAPRIEVVFILDTTSSMSGLIQAAKDKIWSIATTMASAQQNPDVKIGLVAFRDRGDAYVTRVYDLSEDFDSMYVNLMDFRAQGGGDGPESVNQALFDAVNRISWSNDNGVYKVAFLVGDAPPHMDYANEVQYPETLKLAASKGIIVNAIQSGQQQSTRPAWQQIASLGNGEFFQVENSGNAVAVATPFDAKLSKLAAELENTRLYYGDMETKLSQQRKLDASSRLRKELSEEALARRATYNATSSGSKNFLGESELVEAIASGKVDLDDIASDELPASLQAMAPAEQQAVIAEKAKRR
ncbi:MAG: Mg-chelatase subunit ChlD, partial [Gammaproteobacteria bacterium]